MERAGFGNFTRDFSTGEIGRAGVEAMHVVVDRLGIEADYVVFGHIHRRGPLLIDDGRRASDPLWERNGTTLLNTGNWMYVEGLLGRAIPQSPFWPGSMVVVPDDRGRRSWSSCSATSTARSWPGAEPRERWPDRSRLPDFAGMPFTRSPAPSSSSSAC